MYHCISIYVLNELFRLYFKNKYILFLFRVYLRGQQTKYFSAVQLLQMLSRIDKQLTRYSNNINRDSIKPNWKLTKLDGCAQNDRM